MIRAWGLAVLLSAAFSIAACTREAPTEYVIAVRTTFLPEELTGIEVEAESVKLARTSYHFDVSPEVSFAVAPIDGTMSEEVNLSIIAGGASGPLARVERKLIGFVPRDVLALYVCLDRRCPPDQHGGACTTEPLSTFFVPVDPESLISAPVPDQWSRCTPASPAPDGGAPDASAQPELQDAGAGSNDVGSVDAVDGGSVDTGSSGPPDAGTPWAMRFGGGESDRVSALASLGGVVYGGGEFRGGDVAIGPNVFDSPAHTNGVLFAIRPDGSWIWSERLASTNWVNVDAIGVDRTGAVFAGGKVGEDVSLDTPAGTITGTVAGGGGYLLRYDPNSGAARIHMLPSASQVLSLAVDEAHHKIVAAGLYQHAVAFGQACALPEVGRNGKDDAFVAAFDLITLDCLWAAGFGGDADDAATAVAIEPISGDIYVAGQYASTISVPRSSSTIHGDPDFDIFIIQMANDGSRSINWTWMGGSGADRPDAIAVDAASDGVVIVGTFTDGFAVEGTQSFGDQPYFVRTNRTLMGLAVTHGGASQPVHLRTVKWRDGGRLLLAGDLDTDLTLSDAQRDYPLSVTPDGLGEMGGDDVIVLELNAAGELDLLDQYGGAGDDEAYGIEVMDGGDVVLGGRFRRGPVDFHGVELDTIAHDDKYDAYLCRFSPRGP